MPAKHTRRNCAAPETPNQGATSKRARIGDLPAMIVARNRPSRVSEEYDSSSVLTEDAECSRDGELTQTSTTEFSISSPNSFSKVENNDEKQPPSATALLARTLQSCTEPVAGVNNSEIRFRQSTTHGNKVFRCRPRVRYCYERSVVTDIGVDEKRNSSWDSVELK
ncbi:hypothetical protein B0H17DRAFT_1154355 [Mycena rosella]|uniref:Uncharacterized protein n=1 Tax=Mycena rosella TaxID=1033263 RepID=A0AAD7F8F8_MYCRO|nr:hypothetical protein B0H17DRAFT_1154355 [Mycena rosella]